MKILARVLGALLALLIVAVGLIPLLLGTQSGVSLLARQAQSLFPGLFTFSSLEGHLLDRLELRGLQLNLETAEIRVRRFVLDWAPTQLFQRELRIHDIALDGVTYRATALSAPPPPPDQPLELPTLNLPLDIHLERLRVAEVEAVTAPDATPVTVDSIELAADWVADALRLRRLDAALPGVSAHIEGNVVPSGAYALALRNRIEVSREELPALQLNGLAEGDLGQLRLDQTLTGDLGAKLQARIDDPLQKPRWQLDLQQIRVPIQQFVDTLPAQLSGQLTGSGDLQTAHIVGDLALRGDEGDRDFDLDARLDVAAQLEAAGLSINELTLRRPDSPLRVDLSGEIDGDLNLDLSGDWAALQWPLDGVPTVASDSGSLELEGSTEAYRLRAEFGLGGGDIPAGHWTLGGQGDAHRFGIERLHGKLLEGELTATGEVHWAPQVAWELAIDTQHINPGAHYPDWPGRIDLSTALTGRLEDEKPSASVHLRALQGELRGYALDGEGHIDYAPDGIRVDGLTLRSGDARVAAEGAIGAASDLRWEVDVPDLASLLPDAKGDIEAAGKVTGPQLTPRVQADLSATKVSFAGAAVARLTANADYDLSEKTSGKLLLEGSDLTVAGQHIPRLLVEGSGVTRDHKVTLQVQHSMVEGAARLQGGYDGTLWSGQLSDLSLQSEQFGGWRQQRPSSLSAGADTASLDQLCLAREASALCANGTWSPGAGSEGAFELKSLPLNWLKSLLPAGLASATGELSAKGTLRQGDELTADISAKLTPGEMVFVNAAEDLHIPHAGGDAEVRIDKGSLEGSAELGISESDFTVAFTSPDLLAAEDVKQASIGGQLRVRGPNFDYLPAFVPTIETIDGTLDADLDLEGTLGKPVLAGRGRVALASLVIPQAGLDLRDTNVDLDVSDNVARVSGRVTSGGSIELEGNVDLNQPGFPVDATIEGKDFVALNLPDMRLLLSPDLAFTSTTQGMALTGEVKIPEAEILIRNIPQGAVTTSEDIVVAGKDDATDTPQQSPTRLDVNLVLGKSVHVAAIGLDAFLEGGLKVIAEPGQEILASGEIRIIEGTYRAYSQDLKIERGVISYAGSAIDNPGIDIRATRDIDEVVVGINAYGTAKKPKIGTFSTPAMAPRDVISYLVTGKPTNAGAKLSLGRQINDKLSVQVGTDSSTGESEFTTRYRINRNIHLEATSTPGSSAGDVFYNFELE